MHFLPVSDCVNLNSPLLFLCRILNHMAKFFNDTEPHQRYANFFICIIYECTIPVKLGRGGGGGGLQVPFRQSICLSVHSVSVHSVFGFWTFLSRPLIYLLEVLYKYLSWCSTNSTFVAFDQLLRELLQEARSQCPLPSLCFFRADW